MLDNKLFDAGVSHDETGTYRVITQNESILHNNVCDVDFRDENNDLVEHSRRRPNVRR